MTLEELETVIQHTQWFSHLGEPLTNGAFAQIATLGPWTNAQTSDTESERIADQMVWLPSSRDQADPIHGTLLEERLSHRGKKQEYSRRSLEIYKKA